ncbi:MAG: hypothetical protein RL701_1237 [Pseudomonadota bacterium]
MQRENANTRLNIRRKVALSKRFNRACAHGSGKYADERAASLALYV